MKRHVSIFTILLSVFVMVGIIDVAYGIETISANAVVRNGAFETDTSVISPSQSTASEKRSAEFTVQKSSWRGYSLKWLWSDASRVGSADELAVIGDGDEFRKISEDENKWICTVSYSGEGSHTLGVQLDYILFDVEFMGYGSTSGSMSKITGKSIDSSFTLSANAYRKTGYQFLGWTNRVGTAFSDGETVTGSKFWNVATGSFDATLYAKWGGFGSTVTFNANYEGGSVMPSSKPVVYGAPYGELPEPERTGYTFDCWKTDVGTLIKAETIVTATADHALWAQWKANKYKVTLKPEGGQISINEFEATFGQPYSRLPTAVKDGYEFSGWWTLSSGGSLVENNSLVETTADHVLYARYAPKTATVSFNPNGGRVSLSQKDVTFGAAYGDLPVPERDSTDKDGYHTTYSFQGWSLGGTIVTKDTIVSKSGNHILDAVWLENRVPNQYMVSFDPNYDGAPPVPSKKVVYDSAYGNLSTLTRDDRNEGGYHYAYEFLGWFYGATEITEGTVLKIANDHTLTAHWKETKTAKVVTITLDPQGGSGGATSVEATYDKSLPTLVGSALPVRTGYVFGGYWTAPQKDGIQYYYANGAGARTCNLTDDTVLYARWTPISYKIIFDRNGGSGYVAEMNLKYDEVKQLNPGDQKFTRTNYEFLGWSRDPSATEPEFSEHEEVKNLTDQDSATITMYAVWKAQTYTVAFDSNGGTNVVKTQVIVRGVSTALASNEYAKTGYTFGGWAETQSNAVALIVKYKDQAVVKDLAEQDKTNTLYAVWNTNTYYIAFDKNGGTGDPMSVEKFTYDMSRNLPWNTYGPPEHTRFLGWGWKKEQTTADYTNEESVVNLCSDSGVTNTLYAIWEFVPSDFSKALNCDNLYFEKLEDEKWEVVSETPYQGEDCVKHKSVNDEKATIYAETNGRGGVLTFWWRGEYVDDPWSGEQQTTLTVSFEGGSPIVTNCFLNMVWQKIVLEIPSVADQKISFVHGGTSACWLDAVTWEPDGGGEPTQGEAVAATSAGIDGNVFRLTIQTTGGIDYGVWTNADLTMPAAEWGLMETKRAEGSSLDFSLEILPDMPQLFFKAHEVK